MKKCIAGFQNKWKLFQQCYLFQSRHQSHEANPQNITYISEELKKYFLDLSVKFMNQEGVVFFSSLSLLPD